MKKIPLTQSIIIQQMRDGWKLHHAYGLVTRSWVQKGSYTNHMSKSTFMGIYKKKLIEKIEDDTTIPIVHYKLTKLGKTCELTTK